MKQTIFMVLLTASACIGSFAVRPFIGLAVYILYAVLRPQYLWKWAMDSTTPWSFYVAVATIGSLLLTGPRPPAPQPGRCLPGRFRFAWSYAFFLAFVASIVLSYVFAKNRFVAEPYMEEYVKIFVMYYIGIVCITTVGQVWAIFLIYTFSLSYLAFEINYEYFTKGAFWIYHQGYGGLDNNGAGLLLALTVPLCAFAWEYYRAWYRWVFALLIPVVIHAVLMTYSRGAMVSMIAASPFWVLRGKYRKQKLLLGLVVAACVPFLAGKEIADRFFSIEQTDTDASAQGRLKVMGIGLVIAAEHPVFGIGVRNSSLVTFDYGADMQGRVIHSLYLQLAADSGFVAVGCYLVVLCLALRNYQKVAGLARSYDDVDSRRVYFSACGFQAALITFAVGAAFLSLELFEPQYYLFMTAVVMRNIYEAGVNAARAVQPRPVTDGSGSGPGTAPG